MSGRGFNINGDSGARRHSSLLRLAAIGAIALTLGGCAGLGLPFGGERGGSRMADARTTTPKPTLASAPAGMDAVDPSDWETVRRAIATAPETASRDLTWANPDTGSSGTAAVSASIQKDGSLCRAFATTVNDTRGVRRYRGDACLRMDGRWQLYGIAADDAVLL